MTKQSASDAPSADKTSAEASNDAGEYVVSRRNRMRYNAYQRDYQRQRRAALKQGLTYSRKRGDPDTADD